MKNVFTRADHAPGPAPEHSPEPSPEPTQEAVPEAELPVEDEPFVPRSRYVMGRSTKILVCVALVAGGMFAGSAAQKQIDAGTRAQRGTFGTFQNSGAGNGSGPTTPGQGRRGGQTGTGGQSGTAGGGATGGPTPGPSAAPTGRK